MKLECHKNLVINYKKQMNVMITIQIWYIKKVKET